MWRFSHCVHIKYPITLFSAFVGSFTSNLMRFVVPLAGIKAPDFVDLDGIITPNQLSRGIWFPHTNYAWGIWTRFPRPGSFFDVDPGHSIPQNILEIERPLFNASIESVDRCKNLGFRYTFRHCIQQGCPDKFMLKFKLNPFDPVRLNVISAYPLKIFTCHNHFEECCERSTLQRCPWPKDWIHHVAHNFIVKNKLSV